MYGQMISMLFWIAVIGVPACWLLDKGINWMWDRIL